MPNVPFTLRWLTPFLSPPYCAGSVDPSLQFKSAILFQVLSDSSSCLVGPVSYPSDSVISLDHCHPIRATRGVVPYTASSLS
ncbi:unnamed protein product [Protopolystoma xenopodis]|uniref:Uncharacterized protein n=1 Tax=Protopolystoma xenopodis TaxID=117903 RepID=A0A448WKB1_9PLAT|nr:unnamed protein product [Protopolystoma xenopodis]